MGTVSDPGSRSHDHSSPGNRPGRRTHVGSFTFGAMAGVDVETSPIVGRIRCFSAVNLSSEPSVI